MNEFTPEPSLELVPSDELAHKYLESGFTHTNMLFNIGRIEGGPLRGYDLVNPETNDRLFITESGDEESEKLVLSTLGRHSILHPLERTDDFAVYEVSRGARLLVKTLKQGPYRLPYMQSLSARSFGLMESLYKLDAGAFGLNIENIAITHNGDDDGDDIHLTVIPPLSALSNPNQSINPRVAESLREYQNARNLGKAAISELMKRANSENPEDMTLHNFDLSTLLKYFKSTDSKSEAR